MFGLTEASPQTSLNLFTEACAILQLFLRHRERCTLPNPPVAFWLVQSLKKNAPRRKKKPDMCLFIPKCWKIPETDIIGCRRVAVILSQKSSWASRKGVAEYCGVQLDWQPPPTETRWGCSLLATVALKLLHTNGGFTGLSSTLGNINHLEPVCAAVKSLDLCLCDRMLSFGRHGARPSLTVTVTPRPVRNVCTHDCQIRRSLFAPSPWASLQHHHWLRFDQPRVDQSHLIGILYLG